MSLDWIGETESEPQGRAFSRCAECGKRRWVNRDSWTCSPCIAARHTAQLARWLRDLAAGANRSEHLKGGTS